MVKLIGFLKSRKRMSQIEKTSDNVEQPRLAAHLAFRRTEAPPSLFAWRADCAHFQVTANLGITGETVYALQCMLLQKPQIVSSSPVAEEFLRADVLSRKFYKRYIYQIKNCSHHSRSP